MPYYDLIKAWHKWIDAEPRRMEAQLNLARKLRAPADSIYFDTATQKWISASGINNPMVQSCVLSIAQDIRDERRTAK